MVDCALCGKKLGFITKLKPKKEWGIISLALKGMKEAARPVLGNDVIPDLAKVENAIKKNDYEGLSQELTAYASLLYRNRR